MQTRKAKAVRADNFLEAPPNRAAVAAEEQESRLRNKPDAVYPANVLADTRIQGVVRFDAIVGRDGRVQNLTLVSGHPMLVHAALEAAKSYEYSPTLRNGSAVEVATQIEVRFKLPKRSNSRTHRGGQSTTNRMRPLRELRERGTHW